MPVCPIILRRLPYFPASSFAAKSRSSPPLFHFASFITHTLFSLHHPQHLFRALYLHYVQFPKRQASSVFCFADSLLFRSLCPDRQFSATLLRLRAMFGASVPIFVTQRPNKTHSTVLKISRLQRPTRPLKRFKWIKKLLFFPLFFLYLFPFSSPPPLFLILQFSFFFFSPFDV